MRVVGGPRGGYDGRMGADPYAGMRDEEVLERARLALQRAGTMTAGSTERAITWAVFDSAMMELSWRAVRYVLDRLGEQSAAPPDHGGQEPGQQPAHDCDA